ncbi:MAG: cupin domain-containing protein [Actinomycetes bacterium]
MSDQAAAEHASSRGHDHPGGVTDLHGLADELAPAARQASAQRVARTVTTVGALRLTVIALASGAALSEHENPGAATLQVLRGSVVLHTDSSQWRLGAGCIVQIPDDRHGLRAEEDSVVLLTVALRQPRG